MIARIIHTQRFRAFFEARRCSPNHKWCIMLAMGPAVRIWCMDRRPSRSADLRPQRMGPGCVDQARRSGIVARLERAEPDDGFVILIRGPADRCTPSC